ncbi:MAG: endo-1,3(4)-beta-glucanase [Actinobacteria bacterium 13_2_20CM_2_71_6]|nr:MAG: endo-1,3(4)-beta-glucanase [Actinobacteria bacterium 13_2_20CM_2_71_6]
MSPTKAPVQAGKELAGQALPTNQWWTSALTGPLSQPIWAHPLAVRADAGGIQVSSAPPAASANAVITPFVPAVTAGGALSGLKVVGYGAFHVVLRADLHGGGTVDVTLVQGSPVLYLRFTGTAPTLTLATGATLTGKGPTAHVDIAGQRWDVLAEAGTAWQPAGTRLTASGAGQGRVALARVPDGVDTAAWEAAIAGSATDPVTRTSARMAYDTAAGTVTQTLVTERASGRPGVWALLPHQQSGLVRDATLTTMAGTYGDALGPLSLVRSTALRIRVPMPGLLTTAPAVPLPDAARTAVVADLDQDLADPPGAGGSYFGLKELGRLATIAEVARSVGATAQQQAALARLRPQLVDWLTYSGGQDGRYFAYDKTWGGLIAVPAEFGSADYNDHHFQYGYLVRAAAVLAQADPGFLRDYGDTVDLVAREYSGALSGAGSGGAPSGATGGPAGSAGAGRGPGGFPAFRAFNAYLGHSAASGFAPFADGNNQESSSEAVAAWEAVTRWGLVRGNPDLATYGATHYALESATARRYWLGEGLTRPKGYAHTGTGIVWDAKIDYATFFDPRPESVQGIQLLPLTFGSLYRADPKAAAARSAELAKDVGGEPRIWADLFAADLAVADPAAARHRLGPRLPREDSTSRAMVRYWIEMLSAFGPPRTDVAADGPYGLAFGSADRTTMVAVNPTADRRTVTFRAGGKVIATVAVNPGQTVVRKP